VQQGVELAGLVEGDELIGATYVVVAYDDLREGACAEPRSQIGACAFDVATCLDLFKADAFAAEPASRSKAMKTPPHRVHRDVRHM
jgi:hypothetical protein